LLGNDSQLYEPNEFAIDCVRKRNCFEAIWMAEANLNYQTIRTSHAAREAVRKFWMKKEKERLNRWLVLGWSKKWKSKEKLNCSYSSMACWRRVKTRSSIWWKIALFFYQKRYIESARQLEHETNLDVSKYDVCDNVDLNTILQEYEFVLNISNKSLRTFFFII